MGARTPEAGELVAGRYVIGELLGEGSAGAVFGARDDESERDVAIKWLTTNSEDDRERLLREARMLSRTSHPNLVEILGSDEHDGVAFMVMERLHGESLRAHVDGRAVSPGDAVGLLLPVMSGVAAMHRAGYLHRDLKPDNIFVCIDGRNRAHAIKVLDLGIGKAFGAARASLPSLTGSGVVVGTPRYMAPEQLEDDAILDARVDVYALGVCLYELLTGRSPYRDVKSSPRLLKEILAGRVRAPTDFVPGLPEDLVEALMKALSHAPADRFTDVAAFARALEPFAEALRFDEAGVTPPSRPRPHGRGTSNPRGRAHTPALIWALLVLLVVVAARVAFGLLGDSPPVDVPAHEEHSP